MWMSGELDLATAPLLVAALDGAVLRGTDATFDLRDLGFIDASGLRLLMAVRRAIGVGGRVFLRHPGPMVRRVLEFAGLDGGDSSEHEPDGRLLGVLSLLQAASGDEPFTTRLCVVCAEMTSMPGAGIMLVTDDRPHARAMRTGTGPDR
jgi:anti-anti-sigma factor